jgi:hypothetical protein
MELAALPLDGRAGTPPGYAAPAAAPVDHVQIAHRHETLEEICDRFRLIWHLPLYSGENVLAIYWSCYLAIEYGIRSSSGILVTTHGRICEVKRAGNGLVWCTGRQHGGFAGHPFFREDLLALAAQLSLPRDFDDPLVSEMARRLQQSNHVTSMRPRVKSAFRWTPNDGSLTWCAPTAAGTFVEACRALSLATRHELLLTEDSTPLELLPREVPRARVIKGAPSRTSLVVTSFGRMIWCTDRDEGRCLDIPFGEAVIVQPGVLRELITEYLAAGDWSGVEALGGALAALPSLHGLAVT